MDIQNRLPDSALSSGAAAGSPTVDWPLADGAHLVFLLDCRDRFEAQVLEKWAREQCGGAPVQTSFVRLGTRQTHARLTNILGLAWVNESTAEAMPRLWFQPLRVAWFARFADRGGSLPGDLFYGRMTQPGYLRRRWIAHNQPDRMRVIAGAGAWTADIHTNYRARPTANRGGTSPPVVSETGPGAGSFTNWVQEQAYLVLELAERVARGARYKIARLLPHQVFGNPAFAQQLRTIAEESGQPLQRVQARSARYLREMAASQTPFTLDLITALYRAGTRSNHDARIDVNGEQLAHVASMLTDRPVLFLISHKSMLDTCAFSLVLFDANLPIPLTFGGINLNTPGVGALARRAGIIFLRRSFQDNPVYKAVFRRYIDHLIEKRFSLLWALEGTRSRTGKLLQPRFGLFNYVVESILRTRLLNAAFVPVSVAYDQITEVEDYATEQRGKSKQAEGMGWMLRFFQRGKSHGQIFVRFGDAVTLEKLAPPDQLPADLPDNERAALSERLAFASALNMNAATPVTATALITLILLASGKRALTIAEVQTMARTAAILVRRQRVELVGQADFRQLYAVRAVLAQLHGTGIVSYHDDGTERLYSIQPDQHHKAAYYRNTAIHHFLVDAVVEISLLLAAQRMNSNCGDSPADCLLQTAVRLRGIYKFEFYFSIKPVFREEVIARADQRFPGWRDALTAGEDEASDRQAKALSAVRRLLSQSRLLVGHGVMQSFVDAYRVAATQLVLGGETALVPRSEFVSQCLKLGKQQLLQAQIHSPESVSKTLYETAYRLLEHRGLTKADQGAGRESLEAFLRDASGALNTIRELVVAGELND